jgi:hypothetical protein
MANKYVKNSLHSKLDCTIHLLKLFHMLLIIFQDVDTFRNWHDRLGHPGIGMMRKIINNSIGHDMAKAKFPQNKDFCCTACATGKLIVRPSYLKI